MKTLKLSFLMLLLSSITFAQKFNPEIKDGSTMGAYAIMGGDEIEVVFTLSKSDNGVGMKWAVLGYGEGVFQMSKAAVENGKSIFAGQPAPGVVTLGDHETFGLVSKSAFKQLKEQNTFEYNSFKFFNKVLSETVKLNGKEADVMHVVSENGAMKLWILNNPDFPLIVQSSGMPIDIIVTDIK